jgi:hypothetical protein
MPMKVSACHLRRRFRSAARRFGKRGERGSAFVEFMLCSLIWVPLILGTMVIGFNLIRAIQVTQVCRDAGHMYSYGIDFSLPANQALLMNLARGLNMTTTGGNGVIILSTFTYLGDNQCPNGAASCKNYQQTVITNRITVGMATLRYSSFGAQNIPVDGTGAVSPATYLNDPSVRATGFASLGIDMTLVPFAYVSEMYVASPDYDYSSFLPNTGVSARSIF